MTLLGIPADLTNWSMTARSACVVFKARDGEGITQALAVARARGLTVIPHGAGHSYTDAALNTNGIVIDVTGMRQILSWDPQCGIMCVEPGATLRDVIRVALPDGWWPAVTPSTAEATIGGCVAMNVTGKNAWKSGSFGEHVLSLTLLLASGQMLTLSRENDPELFHAFVGSAGFLGVITSITLQFQRVTSGIVDIRIRAAASFDEIVAIFQEEQEADFLEALVDGFAGDHRLGRGIVTCATYSARPDRASLQYPISRLPDRLMTGLARYAGTIIRPAVKRAMHVANSAVYGWSARRDRGIAHHRSLFHDTFYPPAMLALYQTALPRGVVSLQAFVPQCSAPALFAEIVRRSQENACEPLLCVVKRHRPDLFLLSYQVDGFSLEAYYPIIPGTACVLQKMLRELMELVIASGGRLYLAKDALLTPALYRQSVGDATVEAFLALKRRCDPDMLFQSDLFRRIMTGQIETSDIL